MNRLMQDATGQERPRFKLNPIIISDSTAKNLFQHNFDNYDFCARRWKIWKKTVPHSQDVPNSIFLLPFGPLVLREFGSTLLQALGMTCHGLGEWDAFCDLIDRRACSN